jgi:hypothetical protein
MVTSKARSSCYGLWCRADQGKLIDRIRQQKVPEIDYGPQDILEALSTEGEDVMVFFVHSEAQPANLGDSRSVVVFGRIIPEEGSRPVPMPNIPKPKPTPVLDPVKEFEDLVFC